MDQKITKIFLFGLCAILVSCAVPSSSDDGFVTIPAGTYTVGCDENGEGCNDERVGEFEISKYEVTFDEWDKCTEANRCFSEPEDMGWGRNDRPVISVSFEDVQTFLDWKNENKTYEFRLPNPQEYQVILSSLDISTLDLEDCDLDVFGYRRCHNNRTLPVTNNSISFSGVHNILGNVSEFIVLDGVPFFVGGNFKTKTLRPYSMYSIENTEKSFALGFRIVRIKL